MTRHQPVTGVPLSLAGSTTVTTVTSWTPFSDSDYKKLFLKVSLILL